MRIVNSLITLILAFAMSPAALAGDDGNALQLDAVRSQQAEIRAGVQARTGIYARLAERDRNGLLDRQVQVLRMIEGKQTSAELSEAEKISLFNSLEWIAATINQTEDDRMVCERRAVLGSHHKERVCMTVGQKRIATELARRNLSRGTNQVGP